MSVHEVPDNIHFVTFHAVYILHLDRLFLNSFVFILSVVVYKHSVELTNPFWIEKSDSSLIKMEQKSTQLNSNIPFMECKK